MRTSPYLQEERISESKQDEERASTEELAEYDASKGFLDYATEGEEANYELIAILSWIGAESRDIGDKINQQTAKLEKLSKQSKGAKARDVHKITLLAASDMNTFSKRVEVVLPRFETCVKTMEESYSYYVSIANPESGNDIRQISDLRKSITELLSVCKPVKEKVLLFRDSTLSLASLNMSKELNKAAVRQSNAIDGVIANIEHVETFALKVIYLINEKFGEIRTSDGIAEV